MEPIKRPIGNKLQFKTSIKCGGCLERVTPVLNSTKGISQWDVDTTSPEKILTVQTEGATEAEIVSALQKAGFSAELMQI